jgi:hypothetical protein
MMEKRKAIHSEEQSSSRTPMSTNLTISFLCCNSFSNDLGTVNAFYMNYFAIRIRQLENIDPSVGELGFISWRIKIHKLENN